MTDQPAEFSGTAAIREALPAGKGWTYYPLALGIFGFVVAFIIAVIPPASTSTAAGEIVSFPAMFGQYLIALLIGLLSAVLLLVGLIANLLRART